MNDGKGVFLTSHQLFCMSEELKCYRCEKKATYLPKFEPDKIAYCDEHYPFSNDFTVNL
jgi:hypothetical protein